MPPKHRSQRIAAELRTQIRSGRLAPGARVPSARAIVRDHGVAIATATRVLAILRREGLVRAQPGVGTIVRARGGGHAPSRPEMVRTAIAIADDEGLPALALRTVATELGVPTLVVQRELPSMDDLVLAMADAVLAEALPTRTTGGWRAELEAIARAQWEGYRHHAWLVHVISITRPQLLPNGMRHTERVLEVLEPLRLGAEETLRSGVALFAYVRGMAVGLQPEREAEQDTGMSSHEWVDSREALFAPLAARFPALGRLTRIDGIDMSLDALFETGLRYFLDGLAGAAPKRARRAARTTR